MRTWTAEELARFLKLVEGSRYHSAWLFLATTGMRRGEALGLRWQDVDLEGARASIRQTVTAVDHRVRIAPRTKTGRGRAVDLDAATVAILTTHRARQAQEMLKLGRRPEGSTLVFCRPDGRCYHPEHFSDQFDRPLRRLGFEPRIRLHDLRPHVGDPGPRGRRPGQGRLGAARPPNRGDHLGRLRAVTPTMQVDAAEKVSNLIFGSGACVWSHAGHGLPRMGPDSGDLTRRRSAHNPHGCERFRMGSD